MQVSFKYPASNTLAAFLRKKQETPYNYTELCGTQSKSVANYDNDHSSVMLGKGTEVWNKAKSALDRWQQFPSHWTKIYDKNTPLVEGNTVAVSFKLFGLWWINSARIVYTFAEKDKYGFAYGTLHGHVERGEECFWIDRDSDGNIYYHIKAFSRPAFWGAKIAYPLARKYQRRFVKDSMQFMKQFATL